METLLNIILFALLDLVTVRGIKRTFPQFAFRHQQEIRRILIIQVSVMVTILFGGTLIARRISDYRLIAGYYYLFGFLFALYVPKLVYAVFLMIDWGVSTIIVKSLRKPRHLLAKNGLWISTIFIFVVLWGMFFERYRFTVEHVEISFEHLPDAFDGYKIVQVSDIHVGSSAGTVQRFKKAVELINAQEPDLFVFTGDMVNNFANETTPLIPLFSQTNARDGKFAILGNHDYGGYFNWNNSADSVANQKALETAIRQMGFVLLKNQSVTIRRCTDSIALIGTENWGISKKHPKQGDLVKAMDSAQHIPFKLLLSHDPSFWTQWVKGKTDIALTLAGHTHGMQMGLKLGKQHYNPLYLLRFRYLTGLYRTDKQYLYVNRGLGVIVFPGRIGMSPEITVITLRKEKLPVQP